MADRNSDRYGMGMGYTESHDASDRLVIHRRLAGRQLHAFRPSAEGRITGGRHAEWQGIDPLKRLIESGDAVDRARFADSPVALDDVGGTSSVVTAAMEA